MLDGCFADRWNGFGALRSECELHADTKAAIRKQVNQSRNIRGDYASGELMEGLFAEAQTMCAKMLAVKNDVAKLGGRLGSIRGGHTRGKKRASGYANGEQ